MLWCNYQSLLSGWTVSLTLRQTSMYIITFGLKKKTLPGPQHHLNEAKCQITLYCIYCFHRSYTIHYFNKSMNLDYCFKEICGLVAYFTFTLNLNKELIKTKIKITNLSSKTFATSSWLLRSNSLFNAFQRSNSLPMFILALL